MARTHISTKKVQIDKAQATVVAIIAGAVFVTVFSLVSAKALWTQRSYQSRVITVKEKARDQLDKNVDSVDDLVASYTEFISNPVNIIDGNPSGKGEKDGDNARLILDALPSKYDFPAVTTSLEKLLLEKNFKIDGITGKDDEVAQQELKETSSPVPIDIPFQIEATGSGTAIQDLLLVFEKSIRPFQAQKFKLTGGESDKDIKLTFDAKTFYQPGKALSIKQKEVK